MAVQRHLEHGTYELLFLVVYDMLNCIYVVLKKRPVFFFWYVQILQFLLVYMHLKAATYIYQNPLSQVPYFTGSRAFNSLHACTDKIVLQ